jgi:hypothetical protein
MHRRNGNGQRSALESLRMAIRGVFTGKTPDGN